MAKELKLILKDNKVIAQEIGSEEVKEEETKQEPVSEPETSEPEVEASEPTLNDTVNESIKNVELQTEEVRGSTLKLTGLRTLFAEKKNAGLEKDLIRGIDKVDRAIVGLDSAVESMIEESEKIEDLDKKIMPRDEMKSFDSLLSESEQAEGSADQTSVEAELELKNAKRILEGEDEKEDKEKKDKEKEDKEKEDKKKEDKEKEDKEKKEEKEDKKKEGITDILKAKIKEIKEKRAMKKKALYPEKYPTSDWAIKNVQQEVAKKKFPKMYDKGNLMGIDRTKLQGPEFSGELKEFEGKVSDPSKVKDYRKLTSKAIEQAVRDHDLKVRRAIDLAAEQQFKGLIGDPLKESIKTELEEAGMEKEIVDKVVDKAYFDSAEASFQGILHQALDTIINFDDTSFLKLARAVRNTKVAISEEEKPLETSETPANEEEVEETPEEKVSKRRILRKRVAAIKQQIPLISGRSSSDSDEGELYKSYFNDKRVDYRNGLRN